MSETLAAASAMVELQAAKKGLSFALRRGSDSVHAHADRERMIQILANLLVNAVKFTDAGSITVEWRADDRAMAEVHAVEVAERDDRALRDLTCRRGVADHKETGGHLGSNGASIEGMRGDREAAGRAKSSQW